MSDQNDALANELLNAVLPENPQVSAEGYLLKLFALLLPGVAVLGALHWGLAAFSSSGLLNEGWGWGALLVYGIQLAAVAAMPWFSYTLYQFGQAFPANLRSRLAYVLSRSTAFKELQVLRLAGTPDREVVQKVREDLRHVASNYKEEYLGVDSLFNHIGGWVGCLTVSVGLSFLTCLVLHPTLAMAGFLVLITLHLTACALMVAFIEAHTPGQPAKQRVPYFTMGSILLLGYGATFLSSAQPVIHGDARAAASAVVAAVKAACEEKADEVATPQDFPYTATVCAPAMLAYLGHSEEEIAKGISQLHIRNFTLKPPPQDSIPGSVVNSKFWESPVLTISQSSYLSVAYLKRYHALKASTISDQLVMPELLLERH